MRCRAVVDLVVIVVASGCSAATRTSAVLPADAFARAEDLYARSDYAGAAQAYEEQLALQPSDPRNDRVLFRLGLIHLVYGSPEKDPERGEERLRELTHRFPASPLREAADYVLALRHEVAALAAESGRHSQEIRRLESQLEALKRIDLERGDSPR
jgi:tetratricopeptide (TPR) repeat protein